MSKFIKYRHIGEAVKGDGGSKAWHNGQGKMNFGQGKVSEFHFRLRVGTL